MQYDETLALRMQQGVSRKIVIDTLLFMYPQVRKYKSCYFCARWLEMCLSVAPASNPRRPYTEAKKCVKCLRLFKQSLRYFLFFSCLEISRHFSRVLEW